MVLDINEEPDDLLPLLKAIFRFMKRAEKARRLMAKSQRNVLKKARAILAQMNEKEARTLEKIRVELRLHEETLREILKVSENADETLCNVLLAIRQNEYLQAWYPPQNGELEQKVVGKYHAFKTEETYGKATRMADQSSRDFQDDKESQRAFFDVQA